MIKRLRPKYSDEELKEIYKEPHDHSIFPDHILRVDATLELANQLIDESDQSAADLSCGNGWLLDRIAVPDKHYGDYARKYTYHGRIEDTIYEIPEVDVFILCETIEHLDNPAYVLELIREKAKKLILSTPLTHGFDDNIEHYWSFDKEGILELLTQSGWTPQLYAQTLPPLGYVFQIHGAT